MSEYPDASFVDVVAGVGGVACIAFFKERGCTGGGTIFDVAHLMLHYEVPSIGHRCKT